MKKTIRGFTIIELLIVITVIGILGTLGITSYSSIQNNAKDSRRSAAVETISEAIERYYSTNGEYPSCSEMTQSANTVASTTLKSIDPNLLTSPSDTQGTNSISCSNTTQDKYIYLKTCSSYRLNYIKSDGSSVSKLGKNSRVTDPIFSSGGTITDASCIRTHTFSTGTYNITSNRAGVIEIVIDGAGGGGGADYNGYGCDGAGGSLSSIKVGAAPTYYAYGGGGGGCWEDGYTGHGYTPQDGDDGDTVPFSLTGVKGGAGNGGGGYDGGSSGGSGGRVSGSLTIGANSTLTIQVGGGGGGGCYQECGDSGGDGVVTIKYPNG